VDKKKILIVEDEEVMQKAISGAFSSQEFTVIGASDGEQGLIVSLKEHPDIILLDILMPKMDGINMLQKLRSDMWGNKVPVIILTNLLPNTSSVINSVLKNEPVYYLVKSDVKLEEIVSKAKEALKITS
jgi:DNA-binding response OmpR family regulator